MKTRDKTRGGPEIRRWLAAETRDGKAGDPESRSAEVALFQLFQALPAPTPPDGFGDRVLARAGLLPAPAFGWLKWAVTVCVLVAGASCFLWLPVAVELLGKVSWWAPVDLASHAIRALGDGLRRGFAFWELLSRIGGAVGEAASQPKIVATLAAAAAIAVLAFRALLDLTSRERSWTHA